MDGHAHLHSVLPHIAPVGVRCGDSAGKKSAARHVLSQYLTWLIEHMVGVSSWQPPHPQFLMGNTRWKDKVI